MFHWAGGLVLKILVVQESDWLKRGPHQQHHLLERLQTRGHKARIIDFEVDWKKDDKYEPFSKRRIIHAQGKTAKNVVTKVVRPAMIRAPILCYLLIPVFYTIELIRQIRSFKPDIVVGLGILNTYLAALAARLSGIPFVYYLIDSLHTLVPEAPLRPLASLVEKWTMKTSDKIVVINRTLCSYARRLGADCVPEVIPAGIEQKMFHPEIQGQSVRRLLGLKEEEMVLFFMGWLYDFSGLIEVATDIISHPQHQAKLLILGRGDLYPRLRKMADEHREENRIILVDWVPYHEVPRYIAASDICILPAYANEIMRDIVPIKLYEYLACGKPVVTTRLPGVVREFGLNSGIVYARDSEHVFDVALKVFRDSGRYMYHSNNAARFSESLDWLDITDRFESSLRSLVRGSSSRSIRILDRS